MKVLIITQSVATHDVAMQGQQLNDNLAAVLTAATSLTAHCDVLVVGCGADLPLANYTMITKYILLTGLKPEDMQATYLAPILTEIVKNYTHVLVAADSFGKDLLPRIAGILDVAQISDVLAIISPNVFKKPLYAGNVIAEIESFESLKLLTIRPTCFTPAVKISGIPTCEILTAARESDQRAQISGENIPHNSSVDLTKAHIVISGGRSLGSKAAFDELIYGLATQLGAAVGASRAAVEAGYASNDSQVGQTGKIVAPKIYLAVGISGAVQHIAGMKDSKTVLAVNLDPNAQIFEYADYGLVGDLFEIIPELSRLLVGYNF